jgi:hypothetical protein
LKKAIPLEIIPEKSQDLDVNKLYQASRDVRVVTIDAAEHMEMQNSASGKKASSVHLSAVHK